MDGDKLVLDTNILIYLFNGDRDLAELLHLKELSVSIITEMELLSFPDLSEAERLQIKSFLSDATVIELSDAVKEAAIAIRATHRIKLPDAIVLATAEYLHLPLLTADRRLERVLTVDTQIYETKTPKIDAFLLLFQILVIDLFAII